jgi:hypothetical protein
VKYLVIDCTKTNPIRGVVADKGRHVGNTQMLEWGDELRAYAAWVGKYGGKRMLDAFEVQLINDGMLHVWPVDAEGEPLHDECEALEIRRYDDGPRIVWEAKIQCVICCGQGHHNLHGEPVEEDDLCITCDGIGYTTDPEFETDINGEPLRSAIAPDAA